MWLCKNTDMKYKESFVDEKFAKKSTKLESEFSANCNMLSWADDQIRVTLLLALGSDGDKITGVTTENQII